MAVSFGNPELLWLLLFSPLLAFALFWLSRWRGNVGRSLGNPALIRRLIVGEKLWLRGLKGGLWVLAFSLLVIALAKPEYGSRTRILRKRGLDIVFAIDFSKSMLAQDIRPNRIERAKAEVLRMLEILDGDRVGCVAFAGETIEFPMTVDYRAVALFLRDLSPYDMPVGGTAIGRALIASKRLLERSRRQPPSKEAKSSQIVVLITDGEDHEGDPIAAARELAQAGIRVYTAGVGTATGEPIPTYAPDGTWTGYLRDEEGKIVRSALSEEGEATLKRIAEITGGRYHHAGRQAEGLARIREDLARMQKEERKAKRITVREGRYALFLAPAFLLLVLEAILPEAWIRKRKPKELSHAEASS
ncbi:MAG: VWA domain-containing protein [Sandaracinaceae bacterium]|nr:VWA domain-containing protein [Sandaracinaceae bacterium]